MPFSNDVNENSTYKYSATLLDENGDAIALASINSIKMTLIDTITGNIINSRDGQDVKNTNDCTMGSTDGEFVWNVQIEDTTIESPLAIPTNKRETHLATVSVLWASSTKQVNHEIVLKVLNMTSIPQT